MHLSLAWATTACLLAGASIASTTQAQALSDDVRVSSVGYALHSAKQGSVLGVVLGDFEVRRAADDSLAYAGSLLARGAMATAEFGALEEGGVFYLQVPEVGRSIDFAIGRDAYLEPYRAAMLGLYAWRSGVDVDFVFEGTHFHHDAGHLQDGYLDFVGQPGVLKDATGGWYDAGDYGKYVVNSAVTLGVLLQAWEDFRERLEPIALDVPESDGALPDYLAELRFQLDWMLKMQFADGAVSHKLSPIRFAGTVTPADDTSRRYFSPAGTAATAGFTATAAKAARAFADFDAAYSSKLLAAARESYEYLLAHPQDLAADMSDFDNQQYETEDPDDRAWAAAEIWETTGSADALAEFEALIRGLGAEVQRIWDWPDQANLGVFTYLRSKRPGRDSTLVATLTSSLDSVANSIRAKSNGGYGRGMSEYYWGSNGTVARLCVALQTAAQLLGEPRYRDACALQVAHLFGRNQYNRSYVTGVGHNPPNNPHCRRSRADAVTPPYPGYLVGGGQSETDWVDLAASYQTNEIAINWQGALVYALAGFLDDGSPQGEADPPPRAAAGAGGGMSDQAGSNGAAVGGSSRGGGAGDWGQAGAAASADTVGPSGGCGCHVGAAAPWHAWSALLSLVGLAWARQRRRPRNERGLPRTGACQQPAKQRHGQGRSPARTLASQ